MCHCLLLAAGVRKPNYHGSQCLVAVVAGLCVCVLCWDCSGEQLSQAPLAVMARDGCRAVDSEEEEEEEEADEGEREKVRER